MIFLEFNLPEEQQEANEALNVGKLSSAIFQYNQRLRDNEDDAIRAEWAQKLLFEELEDVRQFFEI